MAAESLTAFRAPPELLDELDRHAQENERTRSDVIRSAIRAYIEREDQPAA